jgi:hypothetical protein
MGKSEKEFYNATIREIHQRWEAYAEVMGYKEPVQTVQAKQHKERSK